MKRHVTGAVSTRSSLGTVLAGVGIGLVAAAMLGRAVAPRDQATRGGRAARRVRDGAAILGVSVLADSAMEHFRGGFHNPAMYAAPATAAVSLAASLTEPRPGRAGRLPRAGHALSLAVGVVGLAFHVYNVGKRPGGFCWNNLFYAAPLGAPGALVLAGLLGLASEAAAAVPHERRAGRRARDLREEEGRALAALVSGSLLAETAEVWLLHFRGAFHDPAMYLPVTVPPVAALLLLGEALVPGPHRRRPMRMVLYATSALGMIGTAFHIYGVHRNMGGWANWRQTAIAGPPTPAPLSFAGLGLAGLAALDLIEHRGQDR